MGSKGVEEGFAVKVMFSAVEGQVCRVCGLDLWFEFLCR